MPLHSLRRSVSRATQRRGRHRAAATSEQRGPVFPPSSTVLEAKDYFLRLYEPFVALETAYESRSDGYDALASYFAGMNEGQLKFTESQPVFLVYRPDGSKAMQLFVGPARDGSSPEPPAALLPGSSLAGAGAELCAVLRFDGYITPESASRAVALLKSALERDGIDLHDFEASGGFRILQYGPVYSFSGRENELISRIKL